MILFYKADLLAALATTSTDTTRPNLMQILLERKEDCTRLVATDGHRLHIVEVPGEHKAADPVMLNSDAVRRVCKAAKKADRITCNVYGAAKIKLRLDNGEVFDAASKHRAKAYPDYRQIFTGGGSVAEIAVSAGYLREASTHCSSVAGARPRDNLSPAVMSFEGPLRAFKIEGAKHPDTGTWLTCILMPQRLAA